MEVTDKANTSQCLICHTELVKVFQARPLDYYTKQNYSIACCQKCGYCKTLLEAQDNLAMAYESGSYDHAEGVLRKITRPFMERQEKKKLAMIRQYGNPSSILEIGVGKGYFVRAARCAGIDCTGIEPSQRSFEFASSIVGDAVSHQTLEQFIEKNERQYDALVLWHVLEHLDDVENCLEKIAILLAPGGKVIIAVPNHESWQARIGKDEWYHLDPPRHLHHFTPKALTEMLRAHGYSIDDLTYNSFFMNFTGDLITILNVLSPRKNAIINFLKKNELFYAEGIAGALLSIVWNILLLPFLLPITLIVTELSQLMRTAGTMVVIASKPD